MASELTISVDGLARFVSLAEALGHLEALDDPPPEMRYAAGDLVGVVADKLADKIVRSLPSDWWLDA